MIRKIFLVIIGIAFFAECSNQIREVVVWKPAKPKTSDRITINFRPQRLIISERQDSNVFIVYQLIGDRTVETFRVPMKAKKHHWQAHIKPDPETYLIRLKFEDNTDRMEDNKGFGWNIIIRNREGKIPKNAHYKLGLIFSQENPSGFFTGFNRADSLYKKEISLFPENYKSWYDLWSLKLKKSNGAKKQLDRVRFQLDSLLKNSESHADLFTLAFNANWKLLGDKEIALKYGEMILSKYEDQSIREEIEYSMIFLRNRENQEELINEFVDFSARIKSTEYQKKVYYQLGFSFQKFQRVEQAINYFQKYVEVKPDDLPIYLNLANLYMRKQDYKMAQQMIDEAGASNTEAIYFQSHPWEDPQHRHNQLILNQCQILSTQASMETSLKKYKTAIQYRKRVIQLGTLFPAYEWTKIGDLYYQSGKMDSAQISYIKAVSINSAQEDAIQKLRFLYQIKNKTDAGFEGYLQNAIEKELKASAKFAPEFELADLDGNVFRLSEQKGKVLLLTFWDSWSSACQREIPQLNKLAIEFKDNPDVLFWAISVEAPISINKFIRKNPFIFNLFHSAFEVKKLFNVIGFPTHIVIDSSGKIRYTHIGYSENIKQRLMKDIESILKEDKLIS